VIVDTAQFAAITERVATLEAAYAEPAGWVEQATAAEAVLRRARGGEPAPRIVRSRPQHLRAVQ
jgi:hypothetical protein